MRELLQPQQSQVHVCRPNQTVTMSCPKVKVKDWL